MLDAAILMLAGFVAGIVGAIAGGAGLFSFPAFLYVGVDPVTAAASNFIALAPLGITASIAARGHLRGTSRRLMLMAPAIAGGTAVGALLLIFTSNALFSMLLPILLFFATSLFGLASQVPKALEVGTVGRTDGGTKEQMGLFGASAYAGYFGAGAGIILIAVLSRMKWASLHQANATKNVLLTATTPIAALIFVSGGAVAWVQVFLVMLGAAVGGYTGGLLANRLQKQQLRLVVLLIGYGLSVYYAVDSWILG